MVAQMDQNLDYSSILHALENASAFDLYRLQQAIDVALQDPERIVPAIAALSEGQETTYFDYRTNSERACTVVGKKRTCVTVKMHDENCHYTVPYYTLNMAGVDVSIRQQRDASGMSRQELSIGAQVGFVNSRDGEQITGVVERLNQKSVTIRTRNGKWRVAYSLLFPVYDGGVADRDSIIQGQLLQDTVQEN